MRVHFSELHRWETFLFALDREVFTFTSTWYLGAREKNRKGGSAFLFSWSPPDRAKTGSPAEPALSPWLPSFVVTEKLVVVSVIHSASTRTRS